MNLETLFDRFARTVEERGLHVEGIAAADEKKLLLERRFTPDRPRNIYSHTKSYMVTAAGMAMADGLLSLDDRLADYFPEKLPSHPQEAIFSTVFISSSDAPARIAPTIMDASISAPVFSS